MRLVHMISRCNKIIKDVTEVPTRDHNEAVKQLSCRHSDNNASDERYHDGSSGRNPMLSSQTFVHADADNVRKNGLKQEVACYRSVLSIGSFG